jgi:NADPH:quinone reductase-like Zn-dependent oxidoreductase
MKPESMRYVAHAPGGGPEVLRIEQGKIPAIGPRDVLIEVFFAGVNRPDLLQRAGEYPPKSGLQRANQLCEAPPSPGEAPAPVSELQSHCKPAQSQLVDRLAYQVESIQRELTPANRSGGERAAHST